MAANLILDSGQYFHEVVDEAFKERGVDTYPHVRTYVVDVLKRYLVIENLYDQQDASGKRTRQTLAEMFLSAGQLSSKERFERLKSLGDSSLYLSGFFSDSFQRKIIDVDYYVDMGRMAYDSLAVNVDEDTFALLYREISKKFLELVDVLSFISQKSQMTDPDNLLRQMDVFAKTGSPLVEENLTEKGVFCRPEKSDYKQ
jgi:hypothetical protein